MAHVFGPPYTAAQQLRTHRETEIEITCKVWAFVCRLARNENITLVALCRCRRNTRFSCRQNNESFLTPTCCKQYTCCIVPYSLFFKQCLLWSRRSERQVLGLQRQQTAVFWVETWLAFLSLTNCVEYRFGLWRPNIKETALAQQWRGGSQERATGRGVAWLGFLSRLARRSNLESRSGQRDRPVRRRLDSGHC